MESEEEKIREAMAILGRRVSERKSKASRENQVKAALAAKARRDREREERAALGIVPKEPGKPGRPRKTPVETPTEPKRGRGRPKKSDAPTGAAEGQETL